jgi:CHASE2 domain-containing sensor protein
MNSMTSTRANRRALIAGLICVAALAGVGLLLDLQGVRFPSTLIPGLVAAGVTVAVVLVVRRRG